MGKASASGEEDEKDAEEEDGDEDEAFSVDLACVLNFVRVMCVHVCVRETRESGFVAYAETRRGLTSESATHEEKILCWDRETDETNEKRKK